MTAVLALDQGTTGSTALVIAADGRLLGKGYREFPQHFPEPGEVEHDAEDIFRATLAAGREALQQAKVTPQAVGITNQRETVCVWDRATGRPLHRAIVWQDRRTARRCEQLVRQRKAPLSRRRTGLVIDPYFSASKIEWLLEHAPGVAARVRKGEAVFGTIDTWLLFRLTNGAAFATDPTNASRTMLYDINRHRWDDDLLSLVGVPRAALAEVRPSSGQFAVADAGGVFFLPAFVGLGAPHWAAEARGTIVGVTRGTQRAHLARAALEAMAYSTKDVLDAMTSDARLALDALQVDGGAAANDWLMQFQADLLGVTVARPDLVETTALGAAGLAGLAAGVWKEPGEFLAGRRFTRFAPGKGKAAVQAGAAEWRRAVDAALHWATAKGRKKTSRSRSTSNK